MNCLSINADTLRGWKRALFGVTLAAVVLLFSGNASAWTINSAGTYNLPNHANFTGVVNINAHNVTLDCEGKTINFSSSLSNNCTVDTGRRCGIYVMSKNDVTIKNCVVSGGFYEGILVRNGTDVLIRDTLVTGAADAGIRAENMTRLATHNVDLVSNHDGFDGFGLWDAEIAYTWASLSVRGFYLDGTSGGITLLYDDTEAFNNSVGFFVENMPIWGGALFGGSVETPTLPIEVRAHDNQYQGIRLKDSNSCRLFRTQADHNNNARDPLSGGIYFGNVHNSLVWQSVASNNPFCDFRQDSASSSNSGASGNNLGQTCGPPLN